MDRSSRFQNPVPLSSGGFSKPPPIQSDGVGMKPVSPLLDRFRAMVKEREEEIRVFGGAAGTDEIVRIYEIVLSELTINSKPIITDLTIIAGEQRAHGEGIADAICSRILEVPVEHKLPSLYLLDSIVKNIGKEYIKFFSARLPEVFCEAYAQVNPNMHSAMRHLYRTWSTVFPLSVLQKIEAQLQFSSINGQPSGLSSSRASESPRPTHGIHINPKYLGQFGNSTVDHFVTEGVSSTHAGLTISGSDALRKLPPSASRITRSSSPYRLGPPGSLSPSSPSIEEFGIDSSTKRVVRDYGRSKEEETSEWRKRNWQGNPKPQLKPSTAYKSNTGIDLRGPRALISAYGIDEREKHMNRIHHKGDELESNGGEQMTAVKAWQNTEEEEFDWEDMTSSKQSNDMYSSLRPSADYTGKQSINHAARLSGHGSINSFAGPNDLTSHIPPNFARESAILPPHHSHAQLNPKGGGSLAGGPSDVSTYNSTYDPPAPGNFHNSQILLSNSTLPPEMQIRGQFGIKNTSNNLNSDQGSSRNFPPISSSRPGQNLPLPNSMAPPFNYGYLPQGQSNLIPGVHSSLPILNAPNMPFQVAGPNLQHAQRGPLPRTSQALPIGQNVAQVAPNAPAFSGLISSLMAQGLISLKDQDSIGVEFDQDSLKVRREGAITSLYAKLPRQCKTCGLRFEGQEEHSKHMDWHVTKNRTLKNRKTKPSPKWFVSVDMWLSGAEALGTESAPGFLPVEKTEEKEEDEEIAVPADDSQPACALCGEPFDDFYSDEMEEWMYRGAVYMHAPAGSTVGLDRSELGPIVHAKCRSDSPEDHNNDEMESNEEGSKRRKLQS